MPGSTVLRRTIVWVAMCLLAWVVLLLGYVAPLTPSEGTPSAGTIAVWVGIPLGLVLGAEWKVGHRNTRILAGAQLLGMVLMTVWVLRIVFA